MADMTDDLRAQLSKLSPEARARVESALKDTLEKEIAVETGGRVPGAAASFSRGILFSKSGKSLSLDEEILPGLAEMDEAKFKAFTDRIAQLRGRK